MSHEARRNKTNNNNDDNHRAVPNNKAKKRKRQRERKPTETKHSQLTVKANLESRHTILHFSHNRLLFLVQFIHTEKKNKITHLTLSSQHSLLFTPRADFVHGYSSSFCSFLAHSLTFLIPMCSQFCFVFSFNFRFSISDSIPFHIYFVFLTIVLFTPLFSP